MSRPPSPIVALFVRLFGPLLTAVATVTGNVGLILATVVCGTLGTITGFLPPRGDWTWHCARLWSVLLCASSGVWVKSLFEKELDPQAGYVFLANHQSLYDVPALILGIPGQARFLAKRSLFKIPVFGWGLAAGGFVPVDRADRHAARETFRVAIERLEAGKSIVIFPEETRSPDGELLPFKRGGVLLALRTGYPIVPVGIQGSLGVRQRDSFKVSPGRICVRYGRPIEVEEGGVDGIREMQETVRSEIERLAFCEKDVVPGPEEAA